MEGISGWEILLFLTAVVGWIGSIVPMLPGLPLALLAFIVYAVITGFQEVSLVYVLMAVVMSGTALMGSYFLGSVFAKRYGEVKVPSLAIFGSSLAGLLVFGPFGLVIGPVLVAFVTALFSGLGPEQGIRAAAAVAVSILVSVILEFVVGGWMVYILFSRMFL